MHVHVCAHENKELPAGHQLLDSSWSHRGRRGRLWSLSGCVEDIYHIDHHLPLAYRIPLHRLQRQRERVYRELAGLCTPLITQRVIKLRERSHEGMNHALYQAVHISSASTFSQLCHLLYSINFRTVLSNPPTSKSMYNYRLCNRRDRRARKMKARLISAQI